MADVKEEAGEQILLKEKNRVSLSNLYKAEAVPQLIQVPPLKFLINPTSVHPGSSQILPVVEALEKLSHTIREKAFEVNDCGEYEKFPIEGIWDLVDSNKSPFDEDNIIGWLMIYQPEFVSQELLLQCKKLLEPQMTGQLAVQYVQTSELRIIEGGKSIQMLHIGSYEEEPKTLAIMDQYAVDHGLKRKHKTSEHEIYLRDVRHVESKDYQTILRFQVEDNC